MRDVTRPRGRNAPSSRPFWKRLEEGGAKNWAGCGAEEGRSPTLQKAREGGSKLKEARDCLSKDRSVCASFVLFCSGSSSLVVRLSTGLLKPVGAVPVRGACHSPPRPHRDSGETRSSSPKTPSELSGGRRELRTARAQCTTPEGLEAAVAKAG